MAVEPVFTALPVSAAAREQTQMETADNSRGWPVALWQSTPYEIQLLATLALVAGVILLALRADRVVSAWRGHPMPDDPRPGGDTALLLAKVEDLAADLERARVAQVARGGVDAAAVHLLVQRLDRLSDSVGAVHGRVDDLYQRAASADRLAALESRVDDLSSRLCATCE